MSLEELEQHLNEEIIGDFLTALCNLRFFNAWTWETYPRHKPIMVKAYNPDTTEEDWLATAFGPNAQVIP